MHIVSDEIPKGTKEQESLCGMYLKGCRENRIKVYITVTETQFRRPKKSRISYPFQWFNYPLNATGITRTHNTFVWDYSKLQIKDKDNHACF
jgi:hypothetical protein